MVSRSMMRPRSIGVAMNLKAESFSHLSSGEVTGMLLPGVAAPTL